MPRVLLTRLLLAITGVTAGAVLMLAMLSLINGSQGFAFCTAAGRLGWIVPLIAGLVIGGVSLSLLSTDGAADRGRADLVGMVHACPGCGNAVADDWRLCPSCGRMLGDGDSSSDDALMQAM